MSTLANKNEWRKKVINISKKKKRSCLWLFFSTSLLEVARSFVIDFFLSFLLND